MLDVVTEVVAKERPHGEGVVHDLLSLVFRRRRGLRLLGGSHEDGVVPAHGLSEV